MLWAWLGPKLKPTDCGSEVAAGCELLNALVLNPDVAAVAKPEPAPVVVAPNAKPVGFCSGAVAADSDNVG